MIPKGGDFIEGNRKMNSIISRVFSKVSQGLIDLIVFAISLFAASYIRFEGAIPDIFLKQIAVLLNFPPFFGQEKGAR